MFSPDGRRIVTASGDKTARCGRLRVGRLLAEIEAMETASGARHLARWPPYRHCQR